MNSALSIVFIFYSVTMTNIKCYDYSIISENDHNSNQNFFNSQNSNKNSLSSSIKDDLGMLSAKFRINFIQNNNNYNNKPSIRDDLNKFYTINRYENNKNDNKYNNYDSKTEYKYHNKENLIDDSSYIKQVTQRLIDYITRNRIS